MPANENLKFTLDGVPVRSTTKSDADVEEGNGPGRHIGASQQPDDWWCCGFLGLGIAAQIGTGPDGQIFAKR